jgi:hypothetical protein
MSKRGGATRLHPPRVFQISLKEATRKSKVEQRSSREV